MLITVDESAENQRIDNFLIKKFKGVPKTHFYQMLRKGLIRVNKKRAKPDYHLAYGDVLRMPFLRQGDEKEKPKSPSDKVCKEFLKSIIFENDKFLVINKSYGFASHGGSGIAFGVIEIARFLRPKLKFLELVHRLDRETTGVLILAKKRSVLVSLQKIWAMGEVSKKYEALLKGHLAQNPTIVEAALTKNRLQNGERVAKIDEKLGKKAITQFSEVLRFANYTKVDVTLLTGRMHQIRTHAAFIGHPIIGDDKYGDREFNKLMKKEGFSRLALRCYSISFTLNDTVYNFKIDEKDRDNFGSSL